MQFHRSISCSTLRACNRHIESHAWYHWGRCPTMGTCHSSSHADISNGCNFLGQTGIEQHDADQWLLVSIFCVNSALSQIAINTKWVPAFQHLGCDHSQSPCGWSWSFRFRILLYTARAKYSEIPNQVFGNLAEIPAGKTSKSYSPQYSSNSFRHTHALVYFTSNLFNFIADVSRSIQRKNAMPLHAPRWPAPWVQTAHAYWKIFVQVAYAHVANKSWSASYILME